METYKNVLIRATMDSDIALIKMVIDYMKEASNNDYEVMMEACVINDVFHYNTCLAEDNDRWISLDEPMYTFIGHGEDQNLFQVLDAEGFDVCGEYVTLEDAVSTCERYNKLRFVIVSPEYVKMHIANLLPPEELSLQRVDDVYQLLLSLHTEAEMKELVGNTMFLQETISANL